MKVVHINYFDIIGGASRAAYRIHHALRQAGVESRMLVKEAYASDWTVQVLPLRNTIIHRVQRKLSEKIPSQLHTTNPILHSPNIFSSVSVQQINECDADIVHLHWFNRGMLSIPDITKINKPIIWTLHDMWAFCGAEHVTYEFRWRDGYRKDNRPDYESGFDLNRWTWERKRKYWKHPIQIVTPSRWLFECVQKSALMHKWPVKVIPNTIDANLWKPLDKRSARQTLGISANIPLILFGAMGGGDDSNKGFDLLKESLAYLRDDIANLELIVFGQLPPKSPPDLGFPLHYTGQLHDDISLRLIYNASDALVIPSRLENLPNTGLEAHACGIPIVAFNTGGLPDIVDHLHTGYLARPFDTLDMAQGIKWVLDKREIGSLGNQARKKAVKLFDNHIVAEQYLALYNEVIKNKVS